MFFKLLIQFKLNFSNEFIIDNVGSGIKSAESAICEGWHVPKYENEYQNIYALPHTEDDPQGIRIKRPNQECFNCLATNHKITECPVKHDEERIQIHRKAFATQSLAAQEQMHLFSNRYTSENEQYRGFIPGQISSNLREALDLKPNQLPRFIYLMRNLGYPVGWLKEAVVQKSGLTVVSGGNSIESG